MKKLIVVGVLLAVVLAGCAPHMHRVGTGGKGTAEVVKRQWYILDLAPLNEVDSKAMAGGALDYTIETKANFVDVAIGVFVPFVTSRTVTVIK